MSMTSNRSLASTATSPMTRTSMVCEVSPGANETVPSALSKSYPLLAVLVIVWKATVTSSLDARESDTEKVASTKPLSPSIT